MDSSCSNAGPPREFLLGYVELFAVVDERLGHLDRRQQGREIFVSEPQLSAFLVGDALANDTFDRFFPGPLCGVDGVVSTEEVELPLLGEDHRHTTLPTATRPCAMGLVVDRSLWIGEDVFYRNSHLRSLSAKPEGYLWHREYVRFCIPSDQ